MSASGGAAVEWRGGCGLIDGESEQAWSEQKDRWSE